MPGVAWEARHTTVEVAIVSIVEVLNDSREVSPFGRAERVKTTGLSCFDSIELVLASWRRAHTHHHRNLCYVNFG